MISIQIADVICREFEARSQLLGIRSYLLNMLLSRVAKDVLLSKAGAGRSLMTIYSDVQDTFNHLLKKGSFEIASERWVVYGPNYNAIRSTIGTAMQAEKMFLREPDEDTVVVPA